MAGPRVNPTLFDKLTADGRLGDLVDEGRSAMTSLDPNVTLLRFGAVAQLERFNEAALRATVRRELNWLLNTTRLESTCSLEAYPEVKTSVLNYGVPDLTGRVSTMKAVHARADEIRQAILNFEPRIDRDKLAVEPRGGGAGPRGGVKDNAISFMIRGDVTSAVKALPIEFVADVEVETGQAAVRE
jgi:type VI secretion system protein ImpF